VASLTITPRLDSLIIDHTEQLHAVLLDREGNSLLDRPVVWSSSDPTLASVDSTGQVLGRKSGAVTVRAEVEGRVDSLSIRIVPTRPQVSVISPHSGAELDREMAEVDLRVVHVNAITRIRYTVNSGPEQTPITFGCGGEQCTFLATKLPEGPVELGVVVYDVADVAGWTSTEVSVRSRIARYEAVFLAAPDGLDSRPAEANEHGDVVGTILSPDLRPRPILWTSAGAIELPLEGAAGGRSNTVNENGDVGGALFGRDGCSGGGVIWRDGHLVDVPECGGDVIDLTDTGAALVSRNSSSLEIWQGDLVRPVPLPSTGPCGSSIVGARLNEGRQVAVDRELSSCKSRSVLLVENGVARSVCPERKTCSLGDLNDLGQVAVGTDPFWVEPQVREIYLWSSGQVTRIGMYREGTLPRGLNNLGEIVAMDGSIPVLWSDSAFQVIQITDPAWTIGSVVDINDAGQIVAHGLNSSTGAVGTLLLNPVRE
jgi:hypothetical protein